MRDGKCLINGLLILKWKYWAPIINSPIRIDGIRTNEGYQTPTISNVAKDIFVVPTIFRMKSLNPNWLNSFKTLWNLKVQTYTTDIETIICDKFIKFSILFLFLILILWLFGIRLILTVITVYFFKYSCIQLIKGFQLRRL